LIIWVSRPQISGELLIEGRRETRLVAVAHRDGHTTYRHVLAAQQFEGVPHSWVEAHVENGGAEAQLELPLEFCLTHADAARDLADQWRRGVLRDDDLPCHVKPPQILCTYGLRSGREAHCVVGRFATDLLDARSIKQRVACDQESAASETIEVPAAMTGIPGNFDPCCHSAVVSREGDGF
jgi:hypothetical protein